MKKLLLGSTALLGAIAISGAASAQQVVTKAPFTLQIGGSFSTYFGMNAGGDEGLAGTAANGKKNYDFVTETLLQFQGTAKTDNGLTYGGAVRKYFNTGGNQGATGGGFSALGAGAPSTTDYDRAFIFVQGSFGRVVAGDVNSHRITFNPTGAFQAVGPAWGNGLGPDGGMAALFYNLQGTSFAGTITSPGNYTTIGSASTSRRTKLNYETPDFGGFQAGIGYTPSGGDSGNNFDRTDTLTGGASTTGISGRANFRDVVEVGAKYTMKFSGVEITPNVGGLFGSAYKTLNSTQASLEDASSLFAGLKIEYMGASLAGGYTNSFKSGLAKNNLGTAPNRDSTEGLVISAGYVTGPWAFAGYYQYVTMEGNQSAATSGNDTFRALELAGGYTLAPGLQLWGAVHNYEFKDENVTKRNGTLFILGTTVSF
jgi:predicted porin